jgi:hypothetical protein
VARYEFRGAIGHRIAPRNHGLSLEETLNVASHLFRRSVAALRLFAHGHQYNIVQISIQGALQAFGAGSTRLGNQLRFRQFVGGYHFTRRWRILFANRALDLREAHRRNKEGAGSAQQFIKQNAQHIDIARSGNCVTPNLFGTGMVGSHDPNVGLRHGERVPRGLTIIQ